MTDKVTPNLGLTLTSDNLKKMQEWFIANPKCDVGVSEPFEPGSKKRWLRCLPLKDDGTINLEAKTAYFIAIEEVAPELSHVDKTNQGLANINAGCSCYKCPVHW